MATWTDRENQDSARYRALRALRTARALQVFAFAFVAVAVGVALVMRSRLAAVGCSVASVVCAVLAARYFRTARRELAGVANESSTSSPDYATVATGTSSAAFVAGAIAVLIGFLSMGGWPTDIWEPVVSVDAGADHRDGPEPDVAASQDASRPIDAHLTAMREDGGDVLLWCFVEIAATGQKKATCFPGETECQTSNKQGVSPCLPNEPLPPTHPWAIGHVLLRERTCDRLCGAQRACRVNCSAAFNECGRRCRPIRGSACYERCITGLGDKLRDR